MRNAQACLCYSNREAETEAEATPKTPLRYNRAKGALYIYILTSMRRVFAQRHAPRLAIKGGKEKTMKGKKTDIGRLKVTAAAVIVPLYNGMMDAKTAAKAAAATAKEARTSADNTAKAAEAAAEALKEATLAARPYIKKAAKAAEAKAEAAEALKAAEAAATAAAKTAAAAKIKAAKATKAAEAIKATKAAKAAKTAATKAAKAAEAEATEAAEALKATKAAKAEAAKTARATRETATKAAAEAKAAEAEARAAYENSEFYDNTLTQMEAAAEAAAEAAKTARKNERETYRAACRKVSSLSQAAALMTRNYGDFVTATAEAWRNILGYDKDGEFMDISERLYAAVGVKMTFSGKRYTTERKYDETQVLIGAETLQILADNGVIAYLTSGKLSAKARAEAAEAKAAEAEARATAAEAALAAAEAALAAAEAALAAKAAEATTAA